MKNSFIVYTDNIEYLDELTDAQIGQLYKAQITYSRGEELNITDPMVRLAFKVIKGQLDRDAAKYDKKVANLNENKLNRNQAEIKQKSDRNQTEIKSVTDTDTVTVTDTDTVTVTDTDTDTEKKEKDNANALSKKKPAHPTVEDVKAYCALRGNNVDAERFVDFYTSNGWKVGKNPMKDWKAAVRTWESNDKDRKSDIRGKPVEQMSKDEFLEMWSAV